MYIIQVSHERPKGTQANLSCRARGFAFNASRNLSKLSNEIDEGSKGYRIGIFLLSLTVQYKIEATGQSGA